MNPIRVVVLASALTPLCPAADNLIQHTRRQNLIRLGLDDGNADLEWIGSGAFRFSRNWNSNAPAASRSSSDPVEVRIGETGEALTLETKHLRVRLLKRGLRMLVQSAKDGKVLVAETSPARRAGSSILLERQLPSGEFFFGLGARSTGPLALRKASLESDYPMLLSTLGYAQYFPALGRYSFDLGASDPARCSIAVPVERAFEYFFYYGPSIKDIFEEHLSQTKALDIRSDSDFGIIARKLDEAVVLPSEGGLPGLIRALINGSLSAIRLPAIDLASVEAPPARLFPLATALPIVFRSGAEPRGRLLPLRHRLIPYLQTYLQEARDRGFPVVRALPMQFSKDPKGWEIEDQFMLGDELLAAPALTGARRRSIYLPMGIWTDLRTNSFHSGRQTIEIDVPDGELPLFVRNGSILPLGPEREGGAMEIHYFPKLGGEFFLYETGLGEISQFHAAPAGDFMRVEVESKRDRVYEWVIHHAAVPRSVSEDSKEYTSSPGAGAAMKPRTWYFDERAGNLHICMDGPAGGDRIVNIRF